MYVVCVQSLHVGGSSRGGFISMLPQHCRAVSVTVFVAQQPVYRELLDPGCSVGRCLLIA
jgi:hypothetical protein